MKIINANNNITIWAYYLLDDITTKFANSLEYKLVQVDKINIESVPKHLKVIVSSYYLEKIGLRKDLSIGPLMGLNTLEISTNANTTNITIHHG